MLNAFGMQLIFLPESQKINRHVGMLLNMAVDVWGVVGRDVLVPRSWKPTSVGKKGARRSVRIEAHQTGCGEMCSGAVLAGSNPHDGANAAAAGGSRDISDALGATAFPPWGCPWPGKVPNATCPSL